MSEPVVVPGERDVRGALDTPDCTGAGGDADDSCRKCVVACPPHPQMGGSRSDPRLTAVADALADRGIACLRLDYGPWDGGRGERADVSNALSWARERHERVGLFGYSFGGCLALVTAGDASGVENEDGAALRAVTALAPAVWTAAEVDAVDAVSAVACPGQVVYGSRDDTVDWQPVVERARECDFVVTALPADHHFVGQRATVADTVGPFLADNLATSGRE